LSEDDLPQGMVRWHPEINLIAVRQLDHLVDVDDRDYLASKHESGWLMVGSGHATFVSDRYIAERQRAADAGEKDYSHDDDDDRVCRPARWGYTEQNNLRTIDEFIVVFDPREGR
jgi:hypothetical protein